jgi:hypothetical protein
MDVTISRWDSWQCRVQTPLQLQMSLSPLLPPESFAILFQELMPVAMGLHFQAAYESMTTSACAHVSYDVSSLPLSPVSCASQLCDHHGLS